ncbi:MAG TPA: hypothetical protein VGP62_07060 [Bryobacteraceae bacterium]|jgi:hypothetical protein|nr:hypothetical protein [Bryobacteraceae bacterium]
MKIASGVILMLASAAAIPAQTPAATGKLHASAIQIELVEVGDVSIPAEFRYAIYERLIEQVRDSHKFEKVFRSGDKAAAGVPDLVTLHTSVEAFTEGSQMKRELAPVAMGSTKVDVTTQVTDKDGKKLLDQKVAGKVRIFGENLGATNDLAKRITKLLVASF